MSELFYRRLMSVVDDFGRYYANPALLLSDCFPIRPSWADEPSLSLWVEECCQVGLITVYVVESIAYLELFNFQQRTRPGRESRFPPLADFSGVWPQVSAVGGSRASSPTPPPSPHTTPTPNAAEIGGEPEDSEDDPEPIPKNHSRFPRQNKTRKERGTRNHVNCPCWVTGEFRQVAGCPSHPGDDAAPLPYRSILPPADAPQSAEPARDYPAEWNAAVPEAPVNWNPRHSPVSALRACAEDDDFRAGFGHVCQIAHEIHKARGAEASWLSFEWILRKKAEGYGWYRIAWGDLRSMATANGKEESSDARLLRKMEAEQAERKRA